MYGSILKLLKCSVNKMFYNYLQFIKFQNKVLIFLEPMLRIHYDLMNITFY